MSKDNIKKYQNVESLYPYISTAYRFSDINHEAWDIMIEKRVESKEIERLKKGYCKIKEKCNKGECDCTHEEYNEMCEKNMKLELENERLNNIINKAIDYMNNTFDISSVKEMYEIMNKLEEILKGEDK